jgi:hypothetical protein
MYAGIAQWMRVTQEIDATRVTGLEEVTKSDGYCETCYNEWTEVEITYLDKAGDEQKYGWYGNMSEFIGEITK